MCGSGRALASDPNYWARCFRGETPRVGPSGRSGFFVVALNVSHPRAWAHAHFCLRVRQTLCPSHQLRRRLTRTTAHPTTRPYSRRRPRYCSAHVNARLTSSHALTDSTHQSLAHSSPFPLHTPRHGHLQPQANPNTNHDTAFCPYNHRHITVQHANRALTDRAVPNPRSCTHKPTTAAQPATSPDTLPMGVNVWRAS